MYYLDPRIENLYRIFDQNARKDYLRLDPVSYTHLLSPIVLIIGISNLIGMQILYPIGKINLVTISRCV